MILRDSGQVEEFRIAVNADGDKTYLEADGSQSLFKVPFSRSEVEVALGDSLSSRQSTDPLVALGTTLFNSLFSGSLGRRLWERMAEMERQDRGLRLRIVTNLERTQHLPWELLFDPSRGDFMSLSGRLALVRTRPDGFPEESLPPLGRLRILAAEADPTGELRSTGEDLKILRELSGFDSDRISLEVMEHVTVPALEKRLAGGQYDVFHFAGAGEVLPVISKRGGMRQALRLWDALLDRQELGEMLKQAGVRLAVLNASHSDWIARSVAKYIPAAIGMREDVRAATRLALCGVLYRTLASRSALDLAVTAARQAVDRSMPGKGEWCKVIFYLQQANGVLLQETGEVSQAFESGIPVREQPQKKEIVKARRLLEIHQRNLEALQRGALAVTASEPVRSQAEELRRKIDELTEQLNREETE